jgi:hypothetical protein
VASKLVPSFVVGKRSPATCWDFVNDVRQRVVGAPQITTDGFKPYIPAIDDTFGADSFPFTLRGIILFVLTKLCG